MITMTLDVARAVAYDEANRQMWKHGRKAWNRDDYNVACETLDKLWPTQEREEAIT